MCRAQNGDASYLPCRMDDPTDDDIDCCRYEQIIQDTICIAERRAMLIASIHPLARSFYRTSANGGGSDCHGTLNFGADQTPDSLTLGVYNHYRDHDYPNSVGSVKGPLGDEYFDKGIAEISGSVAVLRPGEAVYNVLQDDHVIHSTRAWPQSLGELGNLDKGWPHFGQSWHQILENNPLEVVVSGTLQTISPFQTIL